MNRSLCVMTLVVATASGCHLTDKDLFDKEYHDPIKPFSLELKEILTQRESAQKNATYRATYTLSQELEELVVPASDADDESFAVLAHEGNTRIECFIKSVPMKWVVMERLGRSMHYDPVWDESKPINDATPMWTVLGGKSLDERYQLEIANQTDSEIEIVGSWIVDPKEPSRRVPISLVMKKPDYQIQRFTFGNKFKNSFVLHDIDYDCQIDEEWLRIDSPKFRQSMLSQ